MRPGVGTALEDLDEFPGAGEPGAAAREHRVGHKTTPSLRKARRQTAQNASVRVNMMQLASGR